MRRRRIDIRAIYLDGRGTPYFYWHGVNVCAIVALAAGCGAYIGLLNPLTYESFGPYRMITASLPATCVAALVHVLLSRLVRRAGLGGYDLA